MTTVAVTGVSGYVGGALLDRLARDPEVTHIIGIDVLEPFEQPSKMRFLRLDIRDPDLVKAIDGADTVVHLAFILDAGRDPELAYDVNVGGVRNLLAAMDVAGTGYLVYPSSAWVYGAHADNDVPLTESSPRRPIAGSTLAQHKADCEVEVAAWQAQHPEVTVAVLRLALVLGPHVENAYSRVLEGPVVLGARGLEPELSVVHEDDAAAALHFAVSRRLSGVYNVCADDGVSRQEVLAIAGKRQVLVAPGRLSRLVRALHALGLLDISPSELAYHLHPTAMSNRRLRAEGWEPAHTTRETLAATVAANAGYLSVGVLRGRRRQWVWAAVVASGGLGVVAGAAVALRRARGRPRADGAGPIDRLGRARARRGARRRWGAARRSG